LVPLCPHGVAGEGCLSYPGQLASESGLRAQFPGGYPVIPGISQQLVINIAVGVGPPPSADPTKTGVFINPVITPQGNTLSSGETFSPPMGGVIGTVTNFDLTNTTVTAENTGTNQIVASTRLLADGKFAMNLPAAPAPGATLYDFFVSGNGAYVVRSH